MVRLQRMNRRWPIHREERGIAIRLLHNKKGRETDEPIVYYLLEA